jgi:hypothetical protein
MALLGQWSRLPDVRVWGKADMRLDKGWAGFETLTGLSGG